MQIYGMAVFVFVILKSKLLYALRPYLFFGKCLPKDKLHGDPFEQNHKLCTAKPQKKSCTEICIQAVFEPGRGYLRGSALDREQTNAFELFEGKP